MVQGLEWTERHACPGSDYSREERGANTTTQSELIGSELRARWSENTAQKREEEDRKEGIRREEKKKERVEFGVDGPVGFSDLHCDEKR